MNRPQGPSVMQENKLATSTLVQRRNRRSMRLREYDYSQAGAYHITVCTRDRECLFGGIADGQMQVSEAGQIVEDVWCALPKFYPSVELDAFVVMPNHVHGIIVIRNGVGAIHESPLRSKSSASPPVDHRRTMLLSKIIGRFKMVSAKEINVRRRTPGQPRWQRNYYDHIIRDEEALRRIRQYITDNPAQWEFDRENPVASTPGNGSSDS